MPRTRAKKRCDISADVEARIATHHGQLAYDMSPQEVIESFKLRGLSTSDTKKLEKILKFLGTSYGDLLVQGNLGECREIIEDMIVANRDLEKIINKSIRQTGGENEEEFSLACKGVGGDQVGAIDLGKMASELTPNGLFQSQRLGDRVTADQKKRILKIFKYFAGIYNEYIKTGYNCVSVLEAMVEAYKEYIDIVGH